MGGQMGWRPDEVRRHSVSDLLAAYEGWLMTQGVQPPLKQSDLESLEDLMARYPDG